MRTICYTCGQPITRCQDADGYVILVCGCGSARAPVQRVTLDALMSAAASGPDSPAARTLSERERIAAAMEGVTRAVEGRPWHDEEGAG